jgi:hypothetical protein
MGTRGRLGDRFKNALAFILTVVVGITFGYAYAAAEALEDKLKARHRDATKHIGQHR